MEGWPAGARPRDGSSGCWAQRWPHTELRSRGVAPTMGCGNPHLPLREPGASWDAGYAALSTIASVACLAILALAARNCMRLWRVPPGEASWALVAAAGLVGLFSALWATGPLTIGVWHWESLVPATFAVYLVVVLVREVKRRLARSKATDQSVDSERLRQ